MTKISALPTDSAPTSTDYVPILDSETSTTKKVLLSDIANNLYAAWQTYNPSYTNLTIGNGTVSAKFLEIGKTVFWRWGLTFGSTTSVTSSNPTISLPATLNTEYGPGHPIGQMVIFDASSGTYFLGMIFEDTGNLGKGQFILGTISGSNQTASGLGTTTPITWATGDKIMINGHFEKA